MRRTGLQQAADRRTRALRRNLAEHLCQHLADAGISIWQLAAAAGLSHPHVARVLAGEESPTPETNGRLAAVLGADLTMRLYPNTGPAIHDRHQAPILEHLLEVRHPRWKPLQEIAVTRPSRGWIDVAFHEPRERVIVASEVQSVLLRLEQLIRRSAAKADSLPSWDDWTQLADQPAISRLLVVRRTRATRQVACDFQHQLRTANPAHPDEAIAALTGTAAWPGPALVWAVIGRGRARLARAADDEQTANMGSECVAMTRRRACAVSD